MKNKQIFYTHMKRALWLVMLLLISVSISVVGYANPPPGYSTDINYIIDQDEASDFSEINITQIYQQGTTVLQVGVFMENGNCLCIDEKAELIPIIYDLVPITTVVVYEWESRYIPSYLTSWT